MNNELKKYIYDVKDFPIEGILFRDITPLLGDSESYKKVVEQITKYGESVNANVIAAPESRGFLFGCPVAFNLNAGFVPIRKPNKLPRETVEVSYDLEYGKNVLCMHKDAIKPGQKVLIVDDLLATGGTTKAAIELIEKLGGEVVGVIFVIELEALKGRELLKGYNVETLIKY